MAKKSAEMGSLKAQNPPFSGSQGAFGHKKGPWVLCASKSELLSGTVSYYGGN